MSGRLLDKKVNGEYPFQYRSAAATDVKKTWEEARKRMEEEKAKRAKIVCEIKRGQK